MSTQKGVESLRSRSFVVLMKRKKPLNQKGEVIMSSGRVMPELFTDRAGVREN